MTGAVTRLADLHSKKPLSGEEGGSDTLSTLIVISLLLIGLALGPLSIMGFGLEKIPGQLIDPRLNNYFLEHGWLWLTGEVSSFWDAPFYYPFPRTMAYSDAHLGTLPVYALYRVFSIDRETSYQLWLLTLFVLNYLSCLLALRAFGLGSLPSAIGAYIFTFSLPVLGHLTHVQLVPRFMVPWAFYFGWQYSREPNWRNLLGLQVALLLQIYIGIYLGFFSVLLLVPFMLLAYLLKEGGKGPKKRITTRLSGLLAQSLVTVISLSLLAPLAWPYLEFARSGDAPVRSWEEVSPLLPTPSSLLQPPEGTLVWAWLEEMTKNPIHSYEHAAFAGIVPWLAMVVTVWRLRSRANSQLNRLVISAAGAILAVLLVCLNVNGFSLYQYVMAIPGIGGVRAVVRIMVVIVFPLSLLVAVFASEVLPPARISRRFKAMTLAFLCLVVLDQLLLGHAALPKAQLVARSTPIVQEVLEKNRHAECFVYMPNPASNPRGLHLDAMMASQTLRMPTINGFTAAWPPYFQHSEFHKFSTLALWLAYIQHRFGRDISSDLLIIGSPEGKRATITIGSERLPPDGFRASIVPASDHIEMAQGEERLLEVAIQNRGTVSWPAAGPLDGRFQVRLAHRWLSGEGRKLEDFNNRYSFPYDLAPGETATFELLVRASPPPGDYVLEIDLVQEHVAWFAEMGSAPGRVSVTIR